MDVVGVAIQTLTPEEAMERIMSWAGDGQPHGVAFVNTHMSMEARDHPDFAADLKEFHLRLPDGMPVVMTARLLGAKGQRQVDGPSTSRRLLQACEARGTPVGFYGSTPDTVRGLVARLAETHPGLKVAYAHAPAFGPMDPAVVRMEVAAMVASGAQLLFVGLGCPKQERWIAARLRDHAPLVMLGVGQVFDILAGTRHLAPAAVRKVGLEWLYRFVHEPRRLWRRVAVLGPRYVWRAGRQVLSRRGRATAKSETA